MNIFLSEQGQQLPGDVLLESVLRSDLAPIPRTLELTVRLKDDLETRLAKGNSIWAGREHLEYTIERVERAQPSGLIQGNDVLQPMKLTAFLTSCRAIGEPRSRAVIAQNTSLGGLYRACGAQVNLGNDFTVGRFACLVGDTPSQMIAVCLQEEGAALVLRNKQLSIERLSVLMGQVPVNTTGQFDSTAAISSDLAERHEIPMCISVADDGAIVRGDFSTARSARFIPGKDARTLRNLSHVLVTRRIADSQLAQQINAGDVVDILGVRFLVITAAHRFRSRDGITDTTSRFWLGDIAL